MKKISTIFILFFYLYSMAQDGTQKQIELSAGVEANGYWAKTGYSYYLSQKDFVRISGQVNLEQIKIKNSDEKEDVKLFFGNIEYYHQVYSTFYNGFSFWVGGGALFGYEKIKDKFLLNGSKFIGESKEIYGGSLGVEIDKYIGQIGYHSDLNIFLSTKMNYFHNSDVGTLQPNIGIGFKFYY